MSAGVIKIHTAPHAFPLENLRNILQAEGIEAEVRTPYLGAARGDLPATECWSELWVEDRDAARARDLMREAAAPPEPEGEPWTCPRCGERSEPQFGACWQCGTTRPGGTG
jgi:hypothetical protein